MKRSFELVTLVMARYRGGRIALHAVAMLGDGCFRFHGAGIARELVSGS